MEMMLVLIGIISGIITGITGVQVGVLVPALMLSGLIPNIKTAVGTVLYVFLPPTAILSVYYLYKKKHVDIYKGNILIVTLLCSVLVGARISSYLSQKIILFLSALLFLTLSGFYFLLWYRH